MRILALVGADGAGKSTQAAALVSHLRASGYRTKQVKPSLLLMDPWRLGLEGSPGLSPRRSRIQGARGAATSVRAAVGYLYAALTYAYMRTFLRGMDYVVCDRFFYQYFYDLVGPAADHLARAFPRPDVVFWLDAPPEVLRARIESLPNGHEPVSYLDQVVRYYRSIALPLGFVRIDASLEPETAADEIWKAVTGGVGRSAA